MDEDEYWKRKEMLDRSLLRLFIAFVNIFHEWI
jgi:hypothetical protein